MYDLKAHIKPSIFKNIFSKIEKIGNAFSISNIMFLKIDGLMCAINTSKIISMYIVLELTY